MRIRKNAKLSSMVESNGFRSGSIHVCKLNQSPWDVIPFASEPYPSYPLHHQFKIEAKNTSNGNGSLGDSIGAIESVSSMKEGENKAIMKVEDIIVIDDDDEDEEVNIGKQFGFKTQSDEEDKLNSLTNKKNDNDNYQLIGNRRERAQAAKKGTSSGSNPSEFYYYSGFGPLWRNRRGGAKIENNKSAIIAQNNTALSSSSQFDKNKKSYYVNDDDNDKDKKKVYSDKKRMRKRIKARSLKSLM